VNPAVRTLAKLAFAAADLPYRTRPGPRILIYHQVGAGLGRQMEVTTAAFEYQMEWLADNGSIVSLDEALKRSGDPDSHRLFVLTFDDGYRDVYDTAFPILRAAEVPFLIYVTTEPVASGRASSPGGQAEPLTWGQLSEMVEAGAEVGSHTHTHPDLRGAPADVVEMELAESSRPISGLDPSISATRTVTGLPQPNRRCEAGIGPPRWEEARRWVPTPTHTAFTGYRSSWATVGSSSPAR
jgi:hypothetical protein